MAHTNTRRAVTIPSFLFIVALALVTAPFAYACALVIDLVTRRTALLATVAWIHLYMACELVAIVAWGVLWSLRRGMSRESWLARHYAIERWWNRIQFQAALKLYGMRLETEGAELLADGPYILLPRHVSIVDNMIPSVFAESAYDIRLRWVLARRLLRQPSVDIYGNRTPNVFVDRQAKHALREVARIGELARGLGPRDAVALFPEGTLYSPAKQRRALDRLRRRRAREQALERSADFRHLLPPDPGGVSMLLRAAPGVDVIFCAHSGLEQGRHRALIAGGGLRGRTLRIHFWRVPASEIPTSSPERRAWLLEQWHRVDQQIERDLAGAPPEPVLV
jgi:1-acyl-sn-glycerol-3-phosphate acyltransferase